MKAKEVEKIIYEKDFQRKAYFREDIFWSAHDLTVSQCLEFKLRIYIK